MRLRITRKLSGSIDGIQLDRFSPGYVYLVGPTVGNYLLAIGAGVPAPDEAPALRLPPDKVMFGPQSIPEQAPRSPLRSRDRRTHSGERTVRQAADRLPRRKPPGRP